MPNTFVIGDTHFGHRKIIEFESAHRPFATIEEHDEELVRRWNAVVRAQDTVWHLGDVLFGGAAFPIISRLNGNKKLVMGNHDHYPAQRYLDAGFTHLAGAASVAGCLLTHIPADASQKYRYKRNIHGHLHSRELPTEFHICVSAEHTGLAPISIDQLNLGEPT